MQIRRRIAIVALLLSAAALARPSADGESWLDRPLSNWNTNGAPLARPAGKVDREALRTRCQIAAARTAGQRALEQAGWVAYDHLDRTLTQGDVEIVAGMADADEQCKPRGFQVFVFAGDRFIGTLSPDVMTTGVDASAGAVRFVGADAISAEFARYGDKDTPCCPTARMTVRYRIDRTEASPRLIPTDVRTTRGQ